MTVFPRFRVLVIVRAETPLAVFCLLLAELCPKHTYDCLRLNYDAICDGAACTKQCCALSSSAVTSYLPRVMCYDPLIRVQAPDPTSHTEQQHAWIFAAFSAASRWYAA